MKRSVIALCAVIIGLGLLAPAATAHKRVTPPRPPATMPGANPFGLHRQLVTANPVGGECWLHAYPPLYYNYAFAYGALTCNDNESFLEIEVCPQVWTGSAWATKTGGPGPNGTYCQITSGSNVADIGDPPNNYAYSYGWTPVCGHSYRTWDWADAQYDGHTYTNTMVSSGTTVC